jgi:hypothetical protein
MYGGFIYCDILIMLGDRMKDDSLYIVAIVAVVAVVGLVIMATGSSTTVVAQESLPDMVESDDSAIAGQAYVSSRFTSSMNMKTSLPHDRDAIQSKMDTILEAKDSCVCWEYPEGSGWECSPEGCNSNPD